MDKGAAMTTNGRKAQVRKLTLGERGGVAILMLVAFMVLAVPLSIAAIQTASGLSRSSQIHNSRFKESSCRNSAVEQAAWRLLYDDGFATSMTASDRSKSYTLSTLSECEEDMDITVTCLGCAGLGPSYTMASVNYTVLAGHQIEFKLIPEDDSQDDLWVAYDTQDYASWLRLPSPSSEDMLLNLHNNPTPPAGDTASQHPLPMDQNPPAAVVLHNYDTDRDVFPGLVIDKNTVPPWCNETDPNKYQNWLTDPLATDFDIVGTPTYNFLTAMKDFKTDKSGTMRVCIRDYDGSSYTMIVDQKLSWTPEDFASGSWVAYGGGTKSSAAFDIQTTYQGVSNMVRVLDANGGLNILSWHTE